MGFKERTDVMTQINQSGNNPQEILNIDFPTKRSRNPEESSNFTLLSTIKINKIVKVIKLSSNGKFLAGGYNDGLVKIWNIHSTKVHKTLNGHKERILDLSWSSGSTLLASTSKDKAVRIWDVISGKCFRILNHENEVFCCNFRPNWAMVASGLSEGVIHIWDVKTGNCFKRLQKYNGFVTAVSFNEDGMFFINSTTSGYWHIWDMAGGKCLTSKQSYYGHSISTVYFSPNDKFIVVLTNTGMLQLWKFLKSTTKLTIFQVYPVNDVPPAIFVLNDKMWVVNVSRYNRELCVWNLETRHILQRLKFSFDKIACTDFHPTAHIIAIAVSNTRRIHVWKNIVG